MGRGMCVAMTDPAANGAGSVISSNCVPTRAPVCSSLVSLEWLSGAHEELSVSCHCLPLAIESYIPGDTTFTLLAPNSRQRSF